MALELSPEREFLVLARLRATAIARQAERDAAIQLRWARRVAS